MGSGISKDEEVFLRQSETLIKAFGNTIQKVRLANVDGSSRSVRVGRPRTRRGVDNNPNLDTIDDLSLVHRPNRLPNGDLTAHIVERPRGQGRYLPFRVRALVGLQIRSDPACIGVHRSTVEALVLSLVKGLVRILGPLSDTLVASSPPSLALPPCDGKRRRNVRLHCRWGLRHGLERGKVQAL